MGRTQAVVDSLVDLMKADVNFTPIRRYVTSAKSLDLDEFPVCFVVVDEDDVTRLGNRNHHRITLLISFTFLDHALDGGRMSYKIADALESLIESNMKITIPTGEHVGFQLMKKTYELDTETTQIMDGVVCEIESKFIV